MTTKLELRIEGKGKVKGNVFNKVYPKAKDFGIWAWSVRSLEKGIERLS